MNTNDLTQLVSLHEEATKAYRDGVRDPARILPPVGMTMLDEVGLSPVFVFDCVDDLSRYGEPSQDVFVELAAVRILYFREVMNCKPAAAQIPESALPRKADQYKGITWLPRIIRKAQCFLEGSLSADIMYGCAGDRAFLKEYGATLPDFLIMVRDTGGDADKALEFLAAAKSR